MHNDSWHMGEYACRVSGLAYTIHIASCMKRGSYRICHISFYVSRANCYYFHMDYDSYSYYRCLLSWKPRIMSYVSCETGIPFYMYHDPLRQSPRRISYDLHPHVRCITEHAMRDACKTNHDSYRVCCDSYFMSHTTHYVPCVPCHITRGTYYTNCDSSLVGVTVT